MTHWPSNSLRANHGRPANTYIHATVALSKSAACSLPSLKLLRHLRLRSVPLACSACPTLTSSTIRPFVWSLRINRPATSVHCPATWTIKGLNRTLPLSRAIMSNSNTMASPGATRTATPTPQGGRTTTEVRPQPVLRLSAPSGVLRLRAEPAERRRIQWAEDVVDNEGMGKKSSKGTMPPDVL
jgi:hypothetical protein